MFIFLPQKLPELSLPQIYVGNYQIFNQNYNIFRFLEAFQWFSNFWGGITLELSAGLQGLVSILVNQTPVNSCQINQHMCRHEDIKNNLVHKHLRLNRYLLSGPNYVSPIIINDIDFNYYRVHCHHPTHQKCGSEPDTITHVR